MLNNIELEESFVVTQVTSKVTQLQVDSVNVLLKIVFVGNEQSAFRTNFFSVVVVSFHVVLQLFCGNVDFGTTAHWTKHAWDFI